MLIVGVAGGSGSGKTYMTSRIRERLPDETLLFPMDNYYRPFSDRSRFERMQINFDDPETLDWELLRSHIRKLQRGEPIQMPEYSYKESTRVGTARVEPSEIVLLEGIYALYDQELNDMMDLGVFVDPDPDVRAVRRLRRDVKDRDRSIEYAAKQYLEQTRVMHEKHVAPTKENADFVLDDPGAEAFVDLVEDLFTEQQASKTHEIKEFIDENL